MESDGMIPLGTFIEFTWHRAGPEPEDLQDYAGPRDVAHSGGVMADKPATVSAPTVLSDDIWKPRRAIDD